MECNKKYTMFENYHTAAKEFANGDMAVYGRLMYILNCYGIENVLIDNLSPVERLFITAVKASIDKSLDMYEKTRKGGAPKGNRNAAKEKTDDAGLKNNCQNNCQNNYQNNYQTNEEEVEEEVEEEGEREREVEKPAPSPSPDFSKKIFDTFRDADLPCCNKNLEAFIKKDFADGVEYLHENFQDLEQKDVEEACENYVSVTNSENMWFRGKYNFGKFVKLKNFKDFLPANFRIENFLKDGEKPPDTRQKKIKNAALPFFCSCGAKITERNRQGPTTYFCWSCRCNFQHEADGWRQFEYDF